MQRVQHRQEEDAGAGDAGGHVAQHVQLGPPWPRGAGSAAPAARRRSTARRASCAARRPPRSGCDRGARAPGWRGGGAAGPPPGERRQGPGPARWAARGPARAAAWTAAAPACARSAPAPARAARAARTARSRSRGTESGSGCWALWLSPFRPSVRRMRCTSTPITPEPSPWRPKAAIASRARSRSSPSEPSSPCSAARIRSRSASRSSRSPGALALGLVAVDLLHAALRCLALHRAEEEAVEHQLEHAAVLLRLGQRGRQRLEEVLAAGPAHGVQSGERVEQLGRAHRHALVSQLVGQLQQPRRHAGRTGGVRHPPVERALTRPCGTR